MSEPAVHVFQPVATKADLDTLDQSDIVAGYREFRRGDPEPGLNRGRAYWHGWMNAARDHHERPLTVESGLLVRELMAAGGLFS